MTKRMFIPGIIFAMMISSAEAHTGVGGTAGLAHGFGHPFSGIDHILAMVAVGLFAATLGGRAMWIVPASFVSMMAMGGALGIAGVGVPFVETGIALSVLVLGLAVAMRWSLPVTGAAALVGFFAIFHGYAHGAEMPASSGAIGYGLGFMVATALLHVVGIGLGVGVGKFASSGAVGVSRVGGGAIALAGLGLLTGVL